MLVAHGWLHESEFKIPSLNLDTIKQQQKQTYRLRNVRAGYVLYRALVNAAVIVHIQLLNFLNHHNYVIKLNIITEIIFFCFTDNNYFW